MSAPTSPAEQESAHVPQLPPIPVPAAPRTLLEGALRIQKDAADLKSVVPWLETEAAGLSEEQRYMVVLAHQGLNISGALLQYVLGQKEGTFQAGGGGPKP